jgi:hypothetical protein
MSVCDKSKLVPPGTETGHSGHSYTLKLWEWSSFTLMGRLQENRYTLGALHMTKLRSSLLALAGMIAVSMPSSVSAGVVTAWNFENLAQ